MATADRLPPGCSLIPMTDTHIAPINWLAGEALEQSRPVADWERELADPALHGWVVVTEAGRVVAFLQGAVVVDEAEVRHLAVAGEWRRQGLGYALMGTFLSAARTAGAVRMVLEVRAHGRAAQQLYRRLGFAQVGVRRRYYQGPPDDALVLSLALTD